MTTYRETLELARMALIEAAAKVNLAIANSYTVCETSGASREGRMSAQEELLLTQSLHGCKSIIKQQIDNQPINNLESGYE